MSKGLKALEYISNFTNFQNGYYKDKLDSIEKELKTLEIIKEKKVDVDTLMFYMRQQPNNKWALNSYNNWVDHNGINERKRLLTQEEYDLLKEVLL